MLQKEYGSWIDARTLHKELKVGKVFGAWIAGCIDKYEFIENEDYKFCSPKRASKGRISKYEFVEDEDYKVCFPKRESKDGIDKYEFVENEDFKLDLPNLANQSRD